MSKKVNPSELVHGKPSGKHEDMTDVLQGWDKRLKESEEHNAEMKKKEHRKGQVKMVRKNAKDGPLPSDVNPEFAYGLSTHDLDVKSDPLYRSTMKIEQKMAQQEKEAKKLEEKLKQKEAEETAAAPKKKLDPTRPTKASLGHTKAAPGEPPLKDTFKMKRFTQFEHGKIDTGLRKAPEAKKE